jgi:hypothetical protein
VQRERRRPLPSAEAEAARPPPSLRPALTVRLRGDLLRRSKRPDVALGVAAASAGLIDEVAIAADDRVDVLAAREGDEVVVVPVSCSGRRGQASGASSRRTGVPRLPATVRHGQPKTRRLRRTEGTHAVPEDAERCGSVLVLADAASRSLCRDFGSARGVRERCRTAMVRKGSPVRVRQRALGNRAAARFSCFRSGSDDHFRALPSEKWSSMAAGGRCAAIRANREARRCRAQGTQAVHAGREIRWHRPPNGRRGLDAIIATCVGAGGTPPRAIGPVWSEPMGTTAKVPQPARLSLRPWSKTVALSPPGVRAVARSGPAPPRSARPGSRAPRCSPAVARGRPPGARAGRRGPAQV